MPQPALQEQDIQLPMGERSQWQGASNVITRRNSQLYAMFRGWKHWHNIQFVPIEQPARCPTGGYEILDDI